jgi:molybdopterin synthase sulfur carrier subunit
VAEEQQVRHRETVAQVSGSLVRLDGGDEAERGAVKSDTSRGTSSQTGTPVVTVRLFAAARLAAGTARVELAGRTVGDVLGAASVRFGDQFAAIASRAQLWVNGEPAGPDDEPQAGDEVAVLPPVSGGAGP